MLNAYCYLTPNYTTMRLLLIATVLVFGLAACKKDSNTYTPLASQIKGKWKVVSIYDKQAGSSQTYPTNINVCTFDFRDTALLKLDMPCNVGSANYSVDENGSFTLSNPAKTNVACAVDENLMEGEIYPALINCYWVELKDGQLRMISSGSNNNLVLEKQ